MEQFKGFPLKMRFTPIPNLFFSRLLPKIEEMVELKTTLYVLEALYGKRGYPRFVTGNELLSNTGLMKSLKVSDEVPAEMLNRALKMALERGVILHLSVYKGDAPFDIYFLNTTMDRRAIKKIQNGEIVLKGIKPGERQADVLTEELPDIFTLYEQNMGILTPMIAEELRSAEKLYPEGWIRDAIREAVNQNKRKWSYVSAILERWSAEGRSDGTYWRDSKTDTDKYIKGKYGHMVQR
ncbi:DnaD domain-containing protein [Chloroflexota bacterium]